MADAWILLIAWATVLTLGVAVRLVGNWQWRQSIAALQIQLPTGLSIEDVVAWLSTVHAATRPSRWGLRTGPPIVLEILATPAGIWHIILAPGSKHADIVAGLQASLPGVRLEGVPDYWQWRQPPTSACELRITSHRRPLATDRAAMTSAGFLATLQPLHEGEEIRAQWIITGARTPAVVRVPSRESQQDLPWWIDMHAPPDADDIRAQRAKHQDLLLHASLRIGAATQTRARARDLVDRALAPLYMLNAPGVQLARRWWIPSTLARSRIRRIALPFGRWPLLLNVREAAGLIGLPTGELYLPGLPAGTARQLPPSPQTPQHGVVVAISNYPGVRTPLRLSTQDRLRHMHMVGPTGAGKSTNLCSMAGYDIAHGDGTVVVDARGDLNSDIADRIPAERFGDVIVIDPTTSDYAIGFNPLQSGPPEQAAGFAYHVLQSIYAQSWGPRTADIVRASLLTLTNTRASNQDPFTLIDLPELLTNAGFRRYVTSQSLSAQLQGFWRWYDNLSDSHRQTVIAPVLNKLRPFTLSRALRGLLGQSHGIDFSDILTNGRVLLVSLKKGLLGAETSSLIGSLVMSSVWQAALARANLPKEQRRPCWLYIDEFQDVVHLPIDLADMLAQARGLGLGLVLAHQYLAQLPADIKAAVTGTTRTHIVFQLGHTDAAELAPNFAPLTAEDLHNLAAFEIAMRPCLGGATALPVTGATLPLPQPTTDGAAVAQASRLRDGLPADEVDTQITARTTVQPQRGTQPNRITGIHGGQP